MAIYEVTLLQAFRGVQTINRFNYVLTGTPAAVTGSFALVSAIGYANTAILQPSTILGVLQACQHEEVEFINIVAKNLYSVTDFYETPFLPGTVGAISEADAMPPFVSFGFKTNRVRSDVARGTKRFIGLNETWVDGGTLTSAALTGLNTLAAEMSAALVYTDEGNTLSYSPAVCGKEKYATPTLTEAYRYYATEVEQLEHTANGILWQAYTTARSQTSRQFGRGQ